MSTELPDWTVKDGRSNSSPDFQNLVFAVSRLIRDSAHDLISGRTDMVARLIVAQLAHKHGMAPTSVDVRISHERFDRLLEHCASLRKERDEAFERVLSLTRENEHLRDVLERMDNLLDECIQVHNAERGTGK